MASLKEIAQRIQDLYEQNYAPDDRFLDIDDFKFHFATLYSTTLETQFQQLRKEGKAETGFANVEIPAGWLVEEVLDIKFDEDKNKFSSTPSIPVFTFKWDGAANALQGIHSSGKTHIIYRKLSLHERRYRQVLPVITDRVFFYLNSPNEIIYWDANPKEKVIVQYVPAIVGLNNDCLISDSIANEIIATLEMMFKAKNGNFIQKVDNQNQNIIPEQQADPNLPKK